jgi:hypothetical protein
MTEVVPAPAPVIDTVVPVVADNVAITEFAATHVNEAGTGLFEASNACAVRFAFSPTFRLTVVGLTATCAMTSGMIVVTSDDNAL